MSKFIITNESIKKSEANKNPDTQAQEEAVELQRKEQEAAWTHILEANKIAMESETLSDEQKAIWNLLSIWGGKTPEELSDMSEEGKINLLQHVVKQISKMAEADGINLEDNANE